MLSNKNVFFPVFTRYFQSKGKAFENMIADLLHHREANQNGGAPLILRVDVPRLRQIANKRMGFLKATYRAFKVSASVEEKANTELIKVHMKMCVKHYHSLIPQIDLIATQWGVTLEDTLSQDDLGLLRTEGSRQRRQTEMDGQLRQQLGDVRREKVRAPIQVSSTTAG
jgi:hypothetical protein